MTLSERDYIHELACISGYHRPDIVELDEKNQEYDDETERMEDALASLKDALSCLHHDDECYGSIQLTIDELEDLIESRRDA